MLDRRTINVLLTTLVFVLAVALVYVVRTILVLFAFSILFAYLIDPAVRVLQRYSLFFKDLKGFHREVRRGTIVPIKNADQHVHQVDLNFNSATRRDRFLGGLFGRSFGWRFHSGCPARLRPGRAIRIDLGGGGRGEKQCAEGKLHV